MTPEQLREVLVHVATRAAAVGDRPGAASSGPPAGALFRPADPRVPGVVADWVTPVAQRWAPLMDLTPRALAQTLAAGLIAESSIETVEVAPSGLLAITLTDQARAGILLVVLTDRQGYAAGPAAAVSDLASESGSLADGQVVTSPGPAAFDGLVGAQLAHARLCRLVRNARAAGVEPADPSRVGGLLRHVTERCLLVHLADLPQRLDTHVADPAQSRSAVTHLAALADEWDQPVWPLTVDDHAEPEHGARLVLAEAAGVVLRNGLGRLGATTPERM